VTDKDVRLLNTRRLARGGNVKQVIYFAWHLAAASTGQADGCDGKLVTTVDGAKNARGVSAGRDGKGEIPCSTKSLELLGEDFPVAVVIGYAGKDRGVGRKCDGRERLALYAKAIHELGGDMLGIGGAPSVTKEENLVPTGERRRGGHDYVGEDVALLLEKGALGGNALVKGCPNRSFYRFILCQGAPMLDGRLRVRQGRVTSQRSCLSAGGRRS